MLLGIFGLVDQPGIFFQCSWRTRAARESRHREFTNTIGNLLHLRLQTSLRSVLREWYSSVRNLDLAFRPEFRVPLELFGDALFHGLCPWFIGGGDNQEGFLLAGIFGHRQNHIFMVINRTFQKLQTLAPRVLPLVGRTGRQRRDFHREQRHGAAQAALICDGGKQNPG